MDESLETATTEVARTRYANLFKGTGIQETVSAIQRELGALPVDQVTEYALANLPPQLLWHPGARELREFLDPVTRVSKVVELGKSGKLAREVIRETAELANRFNPGEEPRKAFWNWARFVVEVDGFLWDVVSPQLRRLLDPSDGRRPQPVQPAPKPIWQGEHREHQASRMDRVRNPRQAPINPPRVLPSAEEQWQSFDWTTELAQRPLEEVVQKAVAIAGRLFIFAELDKSDIPVPVLLHEQAKPIRDSYFAGDHEVYKDLAALPQASDAQLHEVIQHFARFAKPSTDTAIPAWESITATSPNRAWLVSNEPREVAKARIEYKYKPFFEAYNKIPNVARRLLDLVTFPVKTIYGYDADRLTPQDRELATKWLTDAEKENDFRLAQMLSARAAEKVAMRFYRQLGCRVQDVAVQQLSDDKAQSNWKTHDILVDKRPVDVKNARPRDSRTRYAEHIVKRFKRETGELGVTITGVQSPFLQLKYLEEPQAIPPAWRGRVHSVNVLGECSREELDDLLREFTKESDPLDALTIDRGRGLGGNFLPPWVFTYPAELYRRGGHNAYRSAVNRLVNESAPPWDALSDVGVNALPFYVQAATPLPESWRNDLRKWEIELVERITIGKARTSLPHLFLTILTDFLAALGSRRDGYAPDQYRRLLYAGTAMPDADVSSEVTAHLPLGILDPLASIDHLLSTLDTLWAHRAETPLLQFKRFQFTAAGLLRGTLHDSSLRVSLLAWCGSCGASPLVLGKEMACECGYLVCSCGHCKDGCPIGVDRSKESSTT